ncbi:MAG: hypothetical protein AB1714_20040 [Acidobacteriota bacterium]
MRGAARFAIACALHTTWSIAGWLPDLAAEECSTAVVSVQAATDGRPILWKNRDTDELSNRVVFVKDVPYSYLCVVNADDPSGRRAWVGLNRAGFAIMNSVAYNLPQKSGESQDLEGFIMADALRTCRTADDFEGYVKANLGPDVGSRANFGVIDSEGGAALFETHNHGYVRIDAATLPEKYIVNTNFARSGKQGEGKGLVRFERETEVLERAPEGKLSVSFILSDAARDLGNSLLGFPEPEDRRKLPPQPPRLIFTQHSINRAWTANCVVVHGVAEGADPREATMWIIPGEPVCGIAVPLWVEAEEVPAELSEGSPVPLFAETLRLKGILRPYQDDERLDYLDLTRLDNTAASGWLPRFLAEERSILERTAKFTATQPDKAQKAAFEREIAREVLTVLKTTTRE